MKKEAVVATYGCLKPKVDLRDYQIKASLVVGKQLPEEFCLDKRMKVKNQGNINSCVAHSTSSILEYYDGGKHDLSTAFIYGIQKKVCGNSNPGMYLADACKIVKKYGDMLESDCPGNVEVPEAHEKAEKEFKDVQKMTKAYPFHIDSFYACASNDDIKYALTKYGPVLACTFWYNSFKTNKDGVVKFTTTSGGGYHAITVIGWNKVGFICQNSWGTSFGKDGYFILPYEYEIAEARVLVDHPNPAGDAALVKQEISGLKDKLLKFVNAIINAYNEIFKA